MSLIMLPEEILILILNKLDTKSIIAVYETCYRLKNIVSLHNVVRECSFSLNTLATAKSLTMPFFKDIASHLQVLNMCGVQDLRKTSLLLAMKKLKVLKKLDVSHTNITTKDLLDIHKACPTLKSIKINLTFSETEKDSTKTLSRTLISKFQQMFKNFDDVHFVFDHKSLINNLIFILLAEARLKSLTCTYTNITLTKWVPEHEDEVDIGAICETLDLRFVDRKKQILSQIVLPQINLENKDYIIFRISLTHYRFGYDVHCSKSFKQFFSEYFGIDAQTDIEKTKKDIIDPLDQVTRFPCLNVVFLVWNEPITEFSDTFLRSVFQKIQPLIPVNLLPTPLKKELNAYTKNWIFVVQERLQTAEKQNEEIQVPLLKKKRMAPPCVTLDCDEVCKEKKNISLTVYFRENLSNPLTLSTSCSYLKEITHLTLTGYVTYDVAFFNVLFRSCHKLETLDVELFKPTMAKSFSKCLPLSHSLKNLRLVDDFINFSTLFYTLSQCKTLECIHIDEKALIEDIELPDPKLLFVNCVNLFNFTICAPMYESIRLNKLKMYNKVKANLGLHQLQINLIQGNDFHYVQSYESNILLSIFNPVPMFHVTRYCFLPL